MNGLPTARAWCWEIAYQTNGAPVCGFQTKVDAVTGSAWSDARIYYYYARWTGTNWQRRFIAQAGRPLYNGQPDYGGGMALDPQDVNTIYISSDAANPFDVTTTTNVPLGAHYEIYKGRHDERRADVRLVGGDHEFEPWTTAGPTFRAVLAGSRACCGGAGTYNSYTSFYSSIVGLFTTAVPVVPNVTDLPSRRPSRRYDEKSEQRNTLEPGRSWQGGVAPGAGDVAVWDSTVTSANTTTLGANTSWAGLLSAIPAATWQHHGQHS